MNMAGSLGQDKGELIDSPEISPRLGLTMAKATVSLERYISHSMNSVPGFVRSLDAQVIQALLLNQHDAGIKGHLCEIGVHHGRLFLMLALARQHGERALAIDLFED